MDGKIFVYLVCLAGIIGLIVFVNFSNAIDEGTQQLALTQQQVDSMSGTIRSQKELLELRKEVTALLTVCNIMTRDVDAIRNEIRVLRESETSLRRAFEQAVIQVRTDTIGKVFPTVPLANGVTLKNARVQSFDADILTILHSEGVSKIPAESLPPDLQDRLRFGIKPGNSAATYQQPSERYSASSLSTGSFTSTANSAPVVNTSVSDGLLRMMAQQGGSTESSDKKDGKDKKTKGTTRSNKAVVSETGDAGLWKSVTRESLGRAYIPGQGWLEVGPNGPIPGTGRK